MSGPHIVGAGLSGLIAACMIPEATVHERAEARALVPHSAVLRFRSPVVGDVTGIPLRRVRVHKGIWDGERLVAPDIRLANQYAYKVLGAAGLASGDRSIWNCDPVDRWVAPADFYQRLVQRVGTRVRWAEAWEYGQGGPVISTAPLPVVLEAVGEPFDKAEFARAPIHTRQYLLDGVDLYQTVYFPGPDLPGVYRASITGDRMIVECNGSTVALDFPESTATLESAFGLPRNSLRDAPPAASNAKHEYGKIRSLPTVRRQALLLSLTLNHGVYSIGRFATWRNILLDDVVQDVGVVRRLMESTAYNAALHAAQKGN